MAGVTLYLRLSENTLKMLDLVRAEQARETKTPIQSREQFCFTSLREIGKAWTARWNLLQTHGEVAADPAGQVHLTLHNIPETLPAGDDPGSGALTPVLPVFFPDVVYERVERAAKMNVAVRAVQGVPSPWATVSLWATGLLTDVIALARSAQEDQLEEAAVSRADKDRHLAEERERRRKLLLQDPDVDPPLEPSSGGGSVVAVLSEPDSAPSGGGS